jgi:demethylmenaquinone methyltransferase/2-methoxy-6-polyprenyl-1,4-benzoquinol methylase
MTIPTASPAAERTASGVRRMFDRVAPRYDLANSVLSFGQDRRWRTAAAGATGLRDGEVALDVACGTGKLAADLARLEPGATVFGLDFSVEMLRRASGAVPAAAGDALALPLADASVDVVTIAFGLRNLPDPSKGLAEFRRVLRPGGRLVVCEFSHPVLPGFREVYERYLNRLLPMVARRLSPDPEAYEYLARSISAWPSQPDLARRLQQAGFTAVRWRDLSGGIVALHHGTVPR